MLADDRYEERGRQMRWIVTLTLLAGSVACGSAAPRVPERDVRAVWTEGAAHVAGSKRVEVWEQDAATALEPEPSPPSAELARFRAQVHARLGPRADQRALLREKATRGGDDGHNAQVALDLGPAALAPLTRFEAELLTVQMQRMDMLTHPTEVVAAVFRSPDGRRLRVVTYTTNFAGIGSLRPVQAHVDDALAEGWTFWLLWHNHNFWFDGRADVGGVVCPSDHDAALLRAWRDSRGVREAWVTNGLVTGRYAATELDRFRAAP